MPLWTNLMGGVRALLRSHATEREMDDELRQYLDAAVEQKMRAGMSADEALRSASREIGSIAAVKEDIREAGWESSVEAMWTDVRYSLRVLRKSPVFTGVVVVVLALGIGANTAIFSLIDALLLRSLPVSNPEELVEVSHAYFTNPLWEQIRDRQDVFSGVFAWSADRFNLSRAGVARYVTGLWVSGDYFRTLGLNPAAGRLLSIADDQPGCAAQAVLGHGFWQDHYGGTGAVGSTISLNGHPFQIVGVAPAGFFGMEVGMRFDVAIPICAAPLFDGPKGRLAARSWWWLRVAGRPRPGIGMPQLQARMAVLSPQIYGAVVPPNWDSGSQEKFRKRVLKPVSIATGLSGLREPYEQPLHVLMWVVGLVLLIACANVASLFMARAAARGREMAMRRALGASRLRLMRQLMTECVMLSAAGAALGLLVARWGNSVLLHYLSTVRTTAFLDLSLNRGVLGFTAAVAVVTGILFGVAPAIRNTSGSLSAAIKETHASDKGVRSRFRLGVVACQVALSLVLLVTAGLLLHSFWNLATLDLGFERDRILVARVDLVSAKVPIPAWSAVCDGIENGLRAQPGAASVARSFMTPLSNIEWNTFVHSDAPQPPQGEDSLVYFNMVSPTYFETLRSPILAGRNFSSRDTADSAPVAVINQTMARKFFAGVNPVGRTFQVEGEARKLEPPVEVVGIVKDAKYESVREDTFPTVFRPVSQVPGSGSTFEIRAALPEAAMMNSIRKAVADVNPALPLEVHALAAQVNDSMMRERLLATLAAFFGALALILAMVGLYGTLSYLVAQRRVEFGVRMALGAGSRSIVALVMRDVAGLLAAGIAVGIGLSLGAAKLLAGLLFGLQARDPATIAWSAGLLSAVSLTAGYLAARRAAQVSPMVALRDE